MNTLGNGSIKKKDPYKLKEEAFNQLYKEKLEYIRAHNSTLVKVEEHKSAINELHRKNIDTQIYKERDDAYPILSNRIKLRALEKERRYIHKHVKILEKYLDPLRIRLRVMPISRAPLILSLIHI